MADRDHPKSAHHGLPNVRSKSNIVTVLRESLVQLEQLKEI